MTAPNIRFRIDFEGSCSVGFGKIALLEGIARAGSLSQAARDMAMSYRRAWLLVDSMNTGFTKPVVSATAGGSGGGGASLTPFGQEMIETFRALETRVTAVAQAQLQRIARHVAKDQGSQKKSTGGVHRQRLAKNLRTSRAK